MLVLKSSKYPDKGIVFDGENSHKDFFDCINFIIKYARNYYTFGYNEEIYIEDYFIADYFDKNLDINYEWIVYDIYFNDGKIIESTTDIKKYYKIKLDSDNQFNEIGQKIIEELFYNLPDNTLVSKEYSKNFI